MDVFDKIKIGFILFLLMLFILGIVVERVDALSFDEIEERLVEEVKMINYKKVSNPNNELNMNDLAKGEDIRKRVNWLGFYSKNRGGFSKQNKFDPDKIDYHWKDVWKDNIAKVWTESWFVDYYSHDQGDGFGFGALHWSTCKWLADVYNWDYREERKVLRNQKHPENDKIQCKYIIGYSIWLKYYMNLRYNVNNKHLRRMSIAAYNEGLDIGMNYIYSNYYVDVAGRRNIIDGWLEEERRSKNKFKLVLKVFNNY